MIQPMLRAEVEMPELLWQMEVKEYVESEARRSTRGVCSMGRRGLEGRRVPLEQEGERI